MPRYRNLNRPRDAATMRAEEKARKKLRSYFHEHFGSQKRIALETGIAQAILSSMANRADYLIAMEAAIRIDLATGGELKAEMLCPSAAETIRKFLASRAPAAIEAPKAEVAEA